METQAITPQTPAELRKFGFVMTGGFTVIGGVVAWISGGIGTGPQVLWGIAGAFLLLALIAPPAVMRPIQKYWMLLALGLGWVNTRILLTLMFYLVMTPVSLFMKLIGRDALDRKQDQRDSFWRPIPENERFEKKSFERQF